MIKTKIEIVYSQAQCRMKETGIWSPKFRLASQFQPMCKSIWVYFIIYKNGNRNNEKMFVIMCSRNCSQRSLYWISVPFIIKKKNQLLQGYYLFWKTTKSGPSLKSGMVCIDNLSKVSNHLLTPWPLLLEMRSVDHPTDSTQELVEMQNLWPHARPTGLEPEFNKIPGRITYALKLGNTALDCWIGERLRRGFWLIGT